MSQKSKFYAVVGDEITSDVYSSWEGYQLAVDGFLPATYRSFIFYTSDAAWRWICASTDLERVQLESDGESVPELPATEPRLDPHDNPIQLSSQQEEVMSMCERGESLFFTGSAGTGKSVCLRHIIARLRRNHDEGVFVTASTGIAAINIKGQTLHSFAGIGLGKESVKILYHKITKSRGGAALERWLSARVLIIDEISMIDGRLFDKLEELARMLRQDSRPFGGIQLIVCGDFFQLPPVPDGLSNGQKIPIKFAFEADCWKQAIPKMVVLTEVFRQKEGDLIAMLNMMRLGEIDHLGLAIFREVDRELVYADGIKPTELFSLRKQVEYANTARLNALPGETMTFYATDIPGYDMHKNAISPERASKLLDDTLAPRELKLRVGAQVMLTKNIPGGRLVNGSLGTVVSFDSEYLRPRTVSEPQRESDTTNHRASPESVQVRAEPTSPARERIRRRAESQNESNGRDPQRPRGPRYPIVRFTNEDVREITPESFEAVNPLGGVEASRHQIPLILSWALSIHKSQGQTIERVKVNLQGIFEKGQAYVAVSRATSLNGLQVVNFRPEKIMAHPRVIAWSQNIEGMQKPNPVEQEVNPDEAMYWED